MWLTNIKIIVVLALACFICGCLEIVFRVTAVRNVCSRSGGLYSFELRAVKRVVVGGFWHGTRGKLYTWMLHAQWMSVEAEGSISIVRDSVDASQLCIIMNANTQIRTGHTQDSNHVSSRTKVFFLWNSGFSHDCVTGAAPAIIMRLQRPSRLNQFTLTVGNHFCTQYLCTVRCLCSLDIRWESSLVIGDCIALTKGNWKLFYYLFSTDWIASLLWNR